MKELNLSGAYRRIVCMPQGDQPSLDRPATNGLSLAAPHLMRIPSITCTQPFPLSDLSAHFVRYADNDGPLQLTDADADTPAGAPVIPPSIDAFDEQVPQAGEQQLPLLGLKLEFTLPPRYVRVHHRKSCVTRHMSPVSAARTPPCS